MFEQFKENIRLTGETYAAARQGSRSAFEAFKNAPRFKKGLWMSFVGTIILTSIASKYSVPWYYQAVLVITFVLLPLRLWVGRTEPTD